jgi:3-oxoacyl-ACP reductase-like protein
MDATNTVAHENGHGIRTLSATEIAFCGLTHPLFFSITLVEPIWVDLNGGMIACQASLKSRLVTWRKLSLSLPALVPGEARA